MHAGSSTTNPIIMFTNKTHRTMVYRFVEQWKSCMGLVWQSKGTLGINKNKISRRGGER